MKNYPFFVLLFSAIISICVLTGCPNPAPTTPKFTESPGVLTRSSFLLPLNKGTTIQAEAGIMFGNPNVQSADSTMGGGGGGGCIGGGICGAMVKGTDVNFLLISSPFSVTNMLVFSFSMSQLGQVQPQQVPLFNTNTPGGYQFAQPYPLSNIFGTAVNPQLMITPQSTSKLTLSPDGGTLIDTMILQ